MSLFEHQTHDRVRDVLKDPFNDSLGHSDIWMLPMLTLMLFSE